MPARPSRAIFLGVIVALLAFGAVAALANGAQLGSTSATAAPAALADSSSTGAGHPVTGAPSASSGPVTPDSSDFPGTPGTSGSAEPSGTADAASPGATFSSTSAAVPAVEKVWVSVLSATSQTSDDVNTGMTQAAVQTAITQLNSYWSAQSNGIVTIQLAGFETRSLGQGSCDPNTALASEETSAFGGMFANGAWKGTHEHLLILSAESCSADSFATVGGVGGEIFSGNGIGTTEGIPYLLHEFGHNLGFEHADASICTNTTSYDGAAAAFSFTSTVCPTREYDDYFDIMGYTVKNATPNLSSPQRIMSGWLTNYATLTNSTRSITSTLTALGGTGGTQALKVIDPISGDAYYIEYRTDTGLDASSAEFHYALQCDPAMSGYTICELDSNAGTGDVRVLRTLPYPSANAYGTTVMATGLTAGSTDKTKRHTHLNSGDSFTSVDGGFTMRVVSMSPSAGASISVTFGAVPISTPAPVYTTVPAPMHLSTPASAPAQPASIMARGVIRFGV
jgi:hypothetical protein